MDQNWLAAIGVLAVVLVVGCSGGSGSSAAPSSCDRNARVGTYRLTYVEQSGSCGPIDSVLVSFNTDPGSAAGGGCVLNSERWSENDCKLERDVSCSTPSGPVRTVAVTRAETANGSELSGTATFTLGGRYPCTGTYAVDAVRQ